MWAKATGRGNAKGTSALQTSSKRTRKGILSRREAERIACCSGQQRSRRSKEAAAVMVQRIAEDVEAADAWERAIGVVVVCNERRLGKG